MSSNNIHDRQIDIVMVDTNVYDSIAADNDLKGLIERRVSEQKIELVGTRIEEEELAVIPPERDVGQAKIITPKRKPSAVFVLGHSRLSEDLLGTPELNQAYAAIHKGNDKHVEDGMIGASAIAYANIFVTNDKKFSNKFKSINSTARHMTTDEFKSYLASI